MATPSLAPRSSRPSSIVPIEDGLLQIALEMPESDRTVLFTVQDQRAKRTKTSLRVRGTVVAEAGARRKLPLFNADLEFVFRSSDERRLVVGQVEGSVDLPLPGFGFFNGVSLHEVPRAGVSVRLGSDLTGCFAGLDPVQPFLCFDYDAPAWAEGPELSLRSSAGAPGLVVDLRDPAFFLRVEAASLSGFRAAPGAVLRVSASGASSTAEAEVAGRRGGGSLTLEGIVDVESTPLTIDGSLVVRALRTKTEAPSDRQTCVLDGRGTVESRLELHAGTAAMLRLRDAVIRGGVGRGAADLSVTGSLAERERVLGSMIEVAARGSARVRARISSLPGVSDFECEGPLLLRTSELPGAKRIGLADVTLEPASLRARRDGTVLRGVTRSRLHPELHDGGLPVVLELGLGPGREEWKVTVLGELSIGDDGFSLDSVEITRAGFACCSPRSSGAPRARLALVADA